MTTTKIKVIEQTESAAAFETAVNDFMAEVHRADGQLIVANFFRPADKHSCVILYVPKVSALAAPAPMRIN
jgi:hypothetical protein